ncbi:uncharacterized protein C3orf26 homolog isoform X2 [Tripterygium wilfordii]|uniref:uncharacterized protein C3orf26 homolog isoform X2 n=1 Tax=Tripterygium wilfordii TaxID=458696 RepID=UPI0018F86088|nr:uncharacterized protein C3orf26 homolog isoform X2 [Tripterygium wilfordii]
MGSGREDRASLKNPKVKPKRLSPNRADTKQTKKKNEKLLINKTKKNKDGGSQIKTNDTVNNEVQAASASSPLQFFINQLQSANGVQLSSLELESLNDARVMELSQDLGQDVESLGKHMKAAFGPTWKKTLCEQQLLEGKVEPGSPAVIFISTSALRSIELLRGVRSLTKECRAVKLFSKHMKVEEQVSLLKNRVNFASGTPSRIKKLIDIEALGLSRLTVIVLDMHVDVKGYSLFTLPQVRDEFWDLYKNYFHQRLLQGDLRICLFGPTTSDGKFKCKRKTVRGE